MMFQSFTCPICSTIAHGRNDIREGYCPECRAFTRNCTVSICENSPARVAGNVGICEPHYQEIFHAKRTIEQVVRANMRDLGVEDRIMDIVFAGPTSAEAFAAWRRARYGRNAPPSML